MCVCDSNLKWQNDKKSATKKISLLRSVFLSFPQQRISAYFNGSPWAPRCPSVLFENQTSKCREIYSINIIWVSPKSTWLSWLSQQIRHLGQGYANGLSPYPSESLPKEKYKLECKMQLTALLHKWKQIVKEFFAFGVIVDFIELEMIWK